MYIAVGLGFFYLLIGGVIAWGARKSDEDIVYCLLLLFFWMPMILAGVIVSLFKRG